MQPLQRSVADVEARLGSFPVGHRLEQYFGLVASFSGEL